MVFGCSSCVLERQVRLARAVRHISFKSKTQTFHCQTDSEQHGNWNLCVCLKETPTCLFPEEVCVAAMVANVAVENIVGHKGEAGSAEEGIAVKTNPPTVALLTDSCW